MLIYLQNLSTGLLFTEEGTWTDQQCGAKSFRHFLEALIYARDHLSTPVSAYCTFSDPAYNFTVLLRGAADAVEWEKRVKVLSEKLQKITEVEFSA